MPKLAAKPVARPPSRETRSSERVSLAPQPSEAEACHRRGRSPFGDDGTPVARAGLARVIAPHRRNVLTREESFDPRSWGIVIWSAPRTSPEPAMTECPLCKKPLTTAVERGEHELSYLVTCQTCGSFQIEGRDVKSGVFDDAELLPHLYKLSALAKSAKVPIKIDKRTRDDLKEGVPRDRTVEQKLELIVRWIGQKTPEVGHGVESHSEHDYPAAWCKSADEWGTLLGYLGEMTLIAVDPVTDDESIVQLTRQGWQWLQERPKATGSKAFIAMAFDPELDDVKAAIHKAIERAGYDPLRVDDDHYSGGIMDRIITHVRDSKFIVADYTKNRGGVYYEAGVAFGLGIDVINVCNAECLKDGADDRLHFDVRHLVFVPWTAGQLEKFSVDLANHIVAIHGRGPRAPSL